MLWFLFYKYMIAWILRGKHNNNRFIDFNQGQRRIVCIKSFLKIERREQVKEKRHFTYCTILFEFSIQHNNQKAQSTRLSLITPSKDKGDWKRKKWDAKWGNIFKKQCSATYHHHKIQDTTGVTTLEPNWNLFKQLRH